MKINNLFKVFLIIPFFLNAESVNYFYTIKNINNINKINEINSTIVYDINGFDKNGIHRDTGTNYDINGFDINGFGVEDCSIHGGTSVANHTDYDNICRNDIYRLKISGVNYDINQEQFFNGYYFHGYIYYAQQYLATQMDETNCPGDPPFVFGVKKNTHQYRLCRKEIKP